MARTRFGRCTVEKDGLSRVDGNIEVGELMMLLAVDIPSIVRATHMIDVFHPLRIRPKAFLVLTGIFVRHAC